MVSTHYVYDGQARHTMVVLKRKFLLGVMPVSFQAPFVAELNVKDGKTIINGKIDVPPGYYKFSLITFIAAIFLFLSVSLMNGSSLGILLPGVIVLTIAGIGIIKMLVLIGKNAYPKNNKEVIELIQAIATEYPDIKK